MASDPLAAATAIHAWFNDTATPQTDCLNTMCGLGGIFSYADDAPPVDAAELLRIRERMISRGPDGAGLWISPDRRIGLGHRRLAVIDLSPSGSQPMQSADGCYQIVFNGEIYNYRELRYDLVRRGVAFRSQSDTEVLLHLYCHDQEAMLSRLRGMFAFAVWDSVSQSLFLARDPFGIKPLYVSDDGRTLRFASQVKALMAGGAVPADRDHEAELDYWVWGHVREPRTIYRHIRSLEPGSWLRVERSGRMQTGRFQSLERVFAGRPDGLQGGAERAGLAGRPGEGKANGPGISVSESHRNDGLLRDAVLDTVRHHLIADVPVGVFLSSGIDSTTLAALAVECGGSLRTVTLGFEEYRGTAADETPLAEEVARQYGTRHQTVWISRADFEGAFVQFVDDMDQPTIDGLNTWLVSRAVAQVGLKVVLSGLGGDELFGGYPSFRQVPLMRRAMAPFRRLSRVGRTIRRAAVPLFARLSNEKYAGLAEYGGSLEGAYLLRRAVRMPWQVPGGERFQLPQAPRLNADFAAVSYLESSLYMRNQLLRDSDWASMAHSLELRVPLVDVPLARHLAGRWQTGRCATKQDLATTAHPPLPDAVTDRPKTGFSVPVREWLLAGGSASQVRERGLRGWQTTVLNEFFKKDRKIHSHV